MIYVGSVDIALYEDADGTRRVQTEIIQDSGIVKLDEVTIMGMLRVAEHQVRNGEARAK